MTVIKKIDDNIAVLQLNRPKVNAINETMVDELIQNLYQIREDNNIKMIMKL